MADNANRGLTVLEVELPIKHLELPNGSSKCFVKILVLRVSHGMTISIDMTIVTTQKTVAMSLS